MSKDVILKARVDEELARAVDQWAQDHETDRSEAIRVALRRLLGEADRRRRIEEARASVEELAEAGAFDSPEDDDWKVGGFR